MIFNFFFTVICNWSLLVSSKKPSDEELAFVNDRAQHYAENGQEKLSPLSPVVKEPQNLEDITSLDEAIIRIKNLEQRLKDIEYRIPKKYPEVNFLTYKDRKRILVSVLINASLTCCSESLSVYQIKKMGLAVHVPVQQWRAVQP